MSLALLPLFFLPAFGRPASHAAVADPVFFPLNYASNGYPKVTSTMLFGTPSQEPIDVEIDLGSADFWIYRDGAIINWGSQFLGENGMCNVTAEPFYATDKSSTSTPFVNFTATHTYGGNAKVVSSYTNTNDTIHFSASDKVLENIQFGLAEFCRIKQRATDCTGGIQYDPSILGLSAKTNKTPGPSFRQNLLDQGQIESSTLSMWFDEAPEDVNATYHGTALFGAIPKDKYTGDLVKVTPTPPDYSVGYYVATPEWSFGDKVIKKADVGECLIDSGSGQDYLPVVSDDFLNATGLILYENFVIYNGTCDSIPRDAALSIKFKGAAEGTEVTVKMPLRNYARGAAEAVLKDPTKCGMSMQIGETSSCTLASPFFSAAFLAFNDEAGEIAIAQGGVSKGALAGRAGLGEVQVIAKGQGLP